ncbi:MAG: hypothetical protein KME31_36040 [Tolypothrix carrinoi HA7290-LM1]|jgi:hypothetical protein|nr:hypothetical protein [Tolypothrix carrinoi HA7290-LM1]
MSISRIYPFEAFLSAEGKPLIEYEVKEVKKVEKERRDGQNIIKRSPGDVKRTPGYRSGDAFKMRIGMGTVLEQSGDELVEKASGSALCRMALWQYVLCQVETGKLKPNSVTKRLLDYKNALKNLTTPAITHRLMWHKRSFCRSTCIRANIFDERATRLPLGEGCPHKACVGLAPQGKQLLNGKHLQGKLMAKVANMLFDELVQAIAHPNNAPRVNWYRIEAEETKALLSCNVKTDRGSVRR